MQSSPHAIKFLSSTPLKTDYSIGSVDRVGPSLEKEKALRAVEVNDFHAVVCIGMFGGRAFGQDNEGSAHPV